MTKSRLQKVVFCPPGYEHHAEALGLGTPTVVPNGAARDPYGFLADKFLAEALHWISRSKASASFFVPRPDRGLQTLGTRLRGMLRGRLELIAFLPWPIRATRQEWESIEFIYRLPNGGRKSIDLFVLPPDIRRQEREGPRDLVGPAASSGPGDPPPDPFGELLEDSEELPEE